MLCVTGLPLIFHDELERSMQPPLAAPANKRPTIDTLIADALLEHRGSAMRQLGVVSLTLTRL
jgi:uncharacterized iron-regulated membrane protein